MKFRNTLIIGVAALLPLAAMAGESGKATKMPSFDTLDANRDGRISQTEASVDSKIVFSTVDKNGDGYLDKAEWKATMQGSMSPAPQTEPVSPANPGMPQSTDSPVTPQPDTETPRQ